MCGRTGRRSKPRLPDLGEPFLFSTKASQTFWDADYGAKTVLIFGSETGGLPEELHRRFADRRFQMPILSPHVRSLNLSTATAVAMYEVLRQRTARRDSARIAAQ